MARVMEKNPILFITGNKDKFAEAQALFGLPFQQVNIDIPEIQSLDAHEIIRHKLLVAEEHATGNYIVEDTSLYFDCLGGKLPGPLVKWFEKALGISGLADITKSMGNTEATAVTLIGYTQGNGTMHFFEGSLRGIIVPPRGIKDFGWGPIFQPDRHTKTFGEMDRDEKHAISMRGIAFCQLHKFLSTAT